MEKISIIAQAKKKKATDTHAMIIIRGFYNRKPVASISTGHRILLEHWDIQKHLVIKAAPNANLINGCIKMKIQEMEAGLMKQQLCGHQVNRHSLYKAVRGLNGNTDFVEYCKGIIAKEYDNKETSRHYLSELSKLEKFRSPVSFADIDYSFLNSYKIHMKTKLNNTENTQWKTFKFMNTMLNKAVKEGGIINENPFKDFDRGRYKQMPKEGLSIEYCNAIEKMANNVNCVPVLRMVAYRFLLMAYSGMRFADAKKFTTALHVQDGHIVMEYQKCKTKVNNKLHEKLLKIVKIIDQYPLNITNQTFNQYLKLVQMECKIPVNIHSHMGRHTMGGLLAKMKVPVDQAKDILGHKDRKSTLIYYHQHISNIDESIELLNAL
jgi:integrase